MNKLLAFFGYPGSGKSTLIKEFISYNKNFEFFDNASRQAPMLGIGEG